MIGSHLPEAVGFHAHVIDHRCNNRLSAGDWKLPDETKALVLGIFGPREGLQYTTMRGALKSPERAGHKGYVQRLESGNTNSARVDEEARYDNGSSPL